MKATEIPGLNFTEPPTTKLSVLVAANDLNHDSANFVRNTLWQGHRPTCIGVLEGGAFADELQALRDDGIVYLRIMGPHGDGNYTEINKWGGPKAYIDRVRKEFSDRRIYIQFLNESGVEHEDDIPGQIPRNVQCAMNGIEYAYSVGQPIMFNLHGLGGPEDYQIPMLYPLYTLATQINEDARNRGMNNGRPMVISGFDEYYPHHDPKYIGWTPCKNGDDGAIYIYDDPNKEPLAASALEYHNKHQFMTHHYRQINHDYTTYHGDDPHDMFARNNWYQFRFARLYQRLIERGIAIPHIQKEFGPDGLLTRYKGFRRNHKQSNPNLDSWLSEQKYANQLIGMMREGYHTLDKTNPLYPYSEYCIGCTVYILGNPGGWELFNVWAEGAEPAAYQLFEMLGEYAMEAKHLAEEPPVIDPPDPEPEPEPPTPQGQEYAVIRRVRIRDGHSKQAQHLGYLETREIVSLDEASEFNDGTYIWMHHERGWSAVRTVNGATTWLERVTVQPEPPPPPEPNPDDYFTEQQLIQIGALMAAAIADERDQWQAVTSAQDARIAALEAEVERWKPIVATAGWVKDSCLALAQMLEELDTAA